MGPASGQLFSGGDCFVWLAMSARTATVPASHSGRSWGCCRLAGVNPVEYLADVLPRLARGGPRLLDMLPAAWKAARQPIAPAAESVAAPAN
jgi:hypothetical protein